jgi:hypothetical protein
MTAVEEKVTELERTNSSLQKKLSTEKLQHASARTEADNAIAVSKALEDKLKKLAN